MNASDAAQLAFLARGIERCRRCRLWRSRTHAVPGEAPGRKEDEQGKPFVGAAGKYLDALLEAGGLDRDALFITSCVKCRPPHNRNPRPGELAACRANWLVKQIELVSPRLIVLLGAVATATLLECRPTLKDMHGQVFELHGRRYFVTYHPASAMRFPIPARAIQADFRRLKALANS